MSIQYFDASKTFKLDAGNTSYVIRIFTGGYLVHLYYGAKISDENLDYLLVKVGHDSVVPQTPSAPDTRWFSCDIAPFEYPGNGVGDYRPAALQIKD